MRRRLAAFLRRRRRPPGRGRRAVRYVWDLVKRVVRAPKMGVFIL